MYIDQLKVWTYVMLWGNLGLLSLGYHYTQNTAIEYSCIDVHDLSEKGVNFEMPLLKWFDTYIIIMCYMACTYIIIATWTSVGFSHCYQFGKILIFSPSKIWVTWNFVKS